MSQSSYKMDEDLFNPENFEKIMPEFEEYGTAQYESTIRDFGKAVALSAASSASNQVPPSIDSNSHANIVVPNQLRNPHQINGIFLHSNQRPAISIFRSPTSNRLPEMA